MKANRRLLPLCLILCLLALFPNSALAWWGDWDSTPSYLNGTWGAIGDCGTYWYAYGKNTSCTNLNKNGGFNPGFVWNGHGNIKMTWVYTASLGTLGQRLRYRNQAGGLNGQWTDVNMCAFGCSWSGNILDGNTNNVYDWNGIHVDCNESWTTGCGSNCGVKPTSMREIHMWGDKWVYLNDWIVFGGGATGNPGAISDLGTIGGSGSYPFAESGMYVYGAIDTSLGNYFATNLYGGKTPFRVSTGDMGNAGNGNYLNFKGNASNGSNNNCDYCNGYAFAWVETAGGAGPQVSVGSDDGYRIWFNGTLVGDSNVFRGVGWDTDNIGAKGLSAGWNRVLFKIHNGGGGFAGTMGFHHGSDFAQMEPSVNLKSDRYGGFSIGYELDGWYPSISTPTVQGYSSPAVGANLYSNATVLTANGTSAGQGPVPYWQTMQYRWGYGLSGAATNYATVSTNPTSTTWSHSVATSGGHQRIHLFAVSKSGRTSGQASGSTGGWSWSSTYAKYYDAWIDNVAPQNVSFSSVTVASPYQVNTAWPIPLDQGVGVTTGSTEAKGSLADLTDANNYYRRGDVGVQVYRAQPSANTVVSAWSISTTAKNDSGLTPNTQYTYTLEARDNSSETSGYGTWHNTTGQLNSTSVNTLAAPPQDPDDIASTQDGNIATTDGKVKSTLYPAGSTFGFTNPAGFGAGTHGGNQYRVSKFKYTWDKLVNYTFTGSETDWNTGNITLSPTAGDGDYYLHLQSWNVDNIATPTTLNYGPFRYDGTPPNPIISGPTPTYIRQATSGVFVVNFGENISGFTTAGLTITTTGTVTYNVAVTPQTGPPSQSWNVTFSNAAGDGTIKFSVNAGTVSDPAGNASLASSDSALLNVDNTRPTPVITRLGSNPTNSSSVAFQIDFGEAVQNFVPGDITLTLGTGIVSGSLAGSFATGTSGSSVYSINVTGISGTGTVGIAIATDLSNDLAGNLSNAGTYVEFYIDQGSLTCSMSRTSPNPTNLTTVGYQISFNKELLPSSFTTSDLQLTGSLAGGASLDNFTQTQTTPAIFTVDVIDVSGTGSIVLTLPASTVQDYVGNFNSIGCGPVGYSIDQGDFACTITQTSTNPTNASTVGYHIVFGKSVDDFDVGDITLGGTITGTSLSGFSGSGTTYDVNVTGISTATTGTVNISVAADQAHDVASNKNNASGTSVYNIDQGAPTITSINRSAPPTQVTNASSVTYRVTFSEAITGVSEADFTATVASGDIIGASVTSISAVSSFVVDVTVNTGSSGNGDLRLDVIIPGATITDSVGNPLTTGFVTGQIYTIDRVNPTVLSINRFNPATSPTNASSLVYRVTFSKNVNNVDVSDFTLVDLNNTLAGESVTSVSASSGTTIDVTVDSGTGTSGTLRLDVNADTATITDDADNAVVSHFFNGQGYVIDRTPLTVIITRTSPNPNNALSVGYHFAFNKPVADFNSGDVTFDTDIPDAILGSFSGSSTSYDVNVTNIHYSGTVSISLAADVAHDSAGNGNAAVDPVSYTIDQEALLCTVLRLSTNPTNASTVSYQVAFTKTVVDFTVDSLTLGGTISGTSLSNFNAVNGFVYTVDVTGISGSGTVSIELAADVVHDAASNSNTGCGPLAYSIDQSPLTCNITRTSPNPTNASTVGYHFTFSKSVSNFEVGDITLGGTIGGTSLSSFSGAGNLYNVNVTGISGVGTVSIALADGVATDSLGTPNQAAGPVAYTISQTALTVTVNQGGSQADPTNSYPIVFDVVFSDTVSDFIASDVTFGGTAVVAAYNISGSGTTYHINITSLSSEGTIIPSLNAGVAHDTYANANLASTSTDHTVLFSTGTAPQIASWSSVRTHNNPGGGDLSIALDPAFGDSDEDPGPTCESRRFGVRKIVVQFSKPVELVGSIENSFTISGWGMSSGPSNYVTAVSNRTLNGSTFTIDFTSNALPNLYRYKLTINTDSFRDPETLLPVTGDLDCQFRSLMGDINSDPYLDSTDLGAIKAKNRATANQTGNTRYDLNLDGQINVIDLALISTRLNIDECP